MGLGLGSRLRMVFPPLNFTLMHHLATDQLPISLLRPPQEISKDEIADALERIIAGPEKKGAVMNDKKRKLVGDARFGHSGFGSCGTACRVWEHASFLFSPTRVVDSQG